MKIAQTAAGQAAFHFCLYNVSIAIDLSEADGKASQTIAI